MKYDFKLLLLRINFGAVAIKATAHFAGVTQLVRAASATRRYSTGLSALDFHSGDEGWIPSTDSNNTKAKSE